MIGTREAMSQLCAYAQEVLLPQRREPVWMDATDGIVRLMTDPDRRVVRIDDVTRTAGRVFGSSPRMVREVRDRLTREEKITTVHQGWLVNLTAEPAVSLAEAYTAVYPQVIPSLESVLAPRDNTLTAIAPRGLSSGVRTKIHTFWYGHVSLVVLPPQQVHPPGLPSSDYLVFRNGAITSRPEKALCDLLARQSSQRRPVEDLSVPIEEMDVSRIARLGVAMKLAGVLSGYAHHLAQHENSKKAARLGELLVFALRASHR